MAFPFIVVAGNNISFFLLVYILIFRSGILNSFKWSQWYPLQLFALLFGTAAVISVLAIPASNSPDAFNRALAVLPNYLYWVVLMLFFISIHSRLKIRDLYKGIFWGVVCAVISYIFLDPIIVLLPGYSRPSPNNFSFVLVCYSPIAIAYLERIKGRKVAIVFWLFLLTCLMWEGRRAGFGLVAMAGVFVLFLRTVNPKGLVSFVLPIVMLFLVKEISFVENFILKTNERIHGLLYESESIRAEDRSYLLRVAMVQKGLSIFEKHPFTGIGLNNFANVSVEYDEDFDGAEYVVYKEGLQSKSAHNSYIALLAEGGILLLGSFLLILGSCIHYAVRNFSTMPLSHRPVYISLISMAIYLYFISAIVNVFAWFLLAIASALIYKK